MSECGCLIPDENDNCIECGKRIELNANIPENLDLGDMRGIVSLIDATAAAYNDLVKDNTDPKNPSIPRLRLIGGLMTRIPHKTFYSSLVPPSYAAAKKLGYRGSVDRWADLIWDATSPSTSVENGFNL